MLPKRESTPSACVNSWPPEQGKRGDEQAVFCRKLNWHTFDHGLAKQRVISEGNKLGSTRIAGRRRISILLSKMTWRTPFSMMWLICCFHSNRNKISSRLSDLVKFSFSCHINLPILYTAPAGHFYNCPNGHPIVITEVSDISMIEIFFSFLSFFSFFSLFFMFIHSAMELCSKRHVLNALPQWGACSIHWSVRILARRNLKWSAHGYYRRHDRISRRVAVLDFQKIYSRSPLSTNSYYVVNHEIIEYPNSWY